MSTTTREAEAFIVMLTLRKSSPRCLSLCCPSTPTTPTKIQRTHVIIEILFFYHKQFKLFFDEKIEKLESYLKTPINLKGGWSRVYLNEFIRAVSECLNDCLAVFPNYKTTAEWEKV